MKAICTIRGCKEHVKGQGWCRYHYEKLRQRVKCSIDGCTRGAHGFGWCKYHYEKLRTRKKCSVESCVRPRIARGLCNAHLRRVELDAERPIGVRPSGAKHHGWKGGKFEIAEGRVYIKSPDHPYRNNSGYVFRARLVMEKVIGRYLHPEEEVHHKNGIKNDDRPENLAVLTRAEHAALHSLERHRNKLGQYK